MHAPVGFDRLNLRRREYLVFKILSKQSKFFNETKNLCSSVQSVVSLNFGIALWERNEQDDGVRPRVNPRAIEQGPLQRTLFYSPLLVPE